MMTCFFSDLTGDSDIFAPPFVYSTVKDVSLVGFLIITKCLFSKVRRLWWFYEGIASLLYRGGGVAAADCLLIHIWHVVLR